MRAHSTAAAAVIAIVVGAHASVSAAAGIGAALDQVGPSPAPPGVPPVDAADRAARLAEARRELTAHRPEALRALRQALAKSRDESPAGVAHRLRLATLLFELGGLRELRAIEVGLKDVELGAELAESFDLLAALGRSKSRQALPLLVQALWGHRVIRFDRPRRASHGAQSIDIGAGGVVDDEVAIELVFAPFGAALCTLLPPRLRDTDDATAESASVLLGDARCAEARPLLRSWAQSRPHPGAGKALLALGEIGDAADRPLLLAASHERKVAAPAWGARALREIGDEAAITRLIEELRERDQIAAEIALDALLRTPDARVISALLALRAGTAGLTRIEEADIDETLACLANEAGVPVARLFASDPKTIADVADRLAQRRSQERAKRAEASPIAGTADLTALIAARARILERHDATWRTDIRVWDDAIVRASRKRAGLSDAYSTADEVADMLEHRCRAGGARSCLRVARIFQLGNGTRVDGARAVSADEKGCALGLDAACVDQVGMYEVGRGVLKDVPRAARMIRALCDRGASGACSIVGMYRMMGTDGPADQRASYELCFSKAPDARWREWCLFAASSAENDSPPDPVLTARLYRQACALGQKNACARATALEKR